jgi:tight adherence protein C
VSWVLGVSYVLAFVLLLGSMAPGMDPRSRRILGPAPLRHRPREPKSRSFRRFSDAVHERVGRKVERSRLAGEVPSLLDLLAVSVTAGLSPRLALERAPELVTGTLSATLEAARQDVALGAPWRQALETAGRTTGLDELRRLALTLDRAERLGSPIADRLRDLAVEVRLERRTRREERARRAPVQMLFPLVFLILPAFVLSAVVPALLVATRGVL